MGPDRRFRSRNRVVRARRSRDRGDVYGCESIHRERNFTCERRRGHEDDRVDGREIDGQPLERCDAECAGLDAHSIQEQHPGVFGPRRESARRRTPGEVVDGRRVPAGSEPDDFAKSEQSRFLDHLPRHDMPAEVGDTGYIRVRAACPCDLCRRRTGERGSACEQRGDQSRKSRSHSGESKVRRRPMVRVSCRIRGLVKTTRPPAPPSTLQRRPRSNPSSLTSSVATSFSLRA